LDTDQAEIKGDEMTAQNFQDNIVLNLSNSCWTRHYLYWNHPSNPVQMAIQCLEYVDGGFEPIRIEELERRGFSLYADGNPSQWIYTIDRTNEDGTPYVSKL